MQLSRTTNRRMTDMYVLRPLPIRQGLFMAFTRTTFEKLFPNLSLLHGEKIIVKMDLTKLDEEV